MNSISKFTASLATGLSLFLILGCLPANAITVTASGRRVNRDFTSLVKNRNIREIILKGISSLEFTQGSRFQVVLRGSDNVIDHTTVRVENDVLIVSDKNTGNNNFRKFDVVAHVTLPNVNSFISNGTGDIDFVSSYTANELRLKANGTGDIDIPEIRANSIFANLNGTGDIRCSGIIADVVLNLNGTGDFEMKLDGVNSTNVVSNGTGDVILSGYAKSAKYFSFSTGDINAQNYKVANVEARATGTGDIVCYASAVFTGYKNTIASLTCYGGPRDRNCQTKGIVFPKVNESLAEARSREDEEERENEYSSTLHKNAESYTSRAIRKSGSGGNGRLVVIEDGKVVEDTEDDGREPMHGNNLRTRTRANGNVEFMYYDKDGNLVIDRQSRAYLEGDKSRVGEETYGNRDELARNRAEIERSKAEIARTRAEIQRSRAQAQRSRAQANAEVQRSQAAARAEIERSRAELARVRAELARERAALARERERFKRDNVYDDTYGSDYTEFETEETRSNHDENVELVYDTQSNRWVVYRDGKKIDRPVKRVTPAKSRRVKNSSVQGSTRKSSKSTSRSSSTQRKQRGVWENGSERTIFFEDGGQITIFTDENGRQRIISEE